MLELACRPPRSINLDTAVRSRPERPADVAQVPLNARSHVQATATDGRVDLDMANSAGVAQALLDAKADVQAIANDGRTPLDVASVSGCADVAQMWARQSSRPWFFRGGGGRSLRALPLPQLVKKNHLFELFCTW